MYKKAAQGEGPTDALVTEKSWVCSECGENDLANITQIVREIDFQFPVRDPAHLSICPVVAEHEFPF